MVSTYNATIKNEPFDNDFAEDLLDADCEYEQTKYKIEFKYPSEFLDPGHATMPSSEATTSICTESEGNIVVIESMLIVKEEPRFNVCDETSNSEQQEKGNSPCDFNDSKIKRLRTGKKLEFKPDKKTFQCYVCKHVRKNTVELRKHMCVHAKKPFACQQCDRTFSCKFTLNEHKRIYSKKKFFACDQCHRSFTHKSTLDQHKPIHKNKKRFTCDQCDLKFLRKSTLDRHRIIHTGQRPFACPQCDRRFSDTSTLHKHKRIHTGEKSFACDQCDLKCSRRSTINRHKLIHTGEKPFACDQCDRKFTRNSTLGAHKRLHTDEKPFSCD
jgi:KRAB domain-containing zinc finger protein